MSEDKKNETNETRSDEGAEVDATQEQHDPGSNQSGPKFTEAPDPIGGAKKSVDNLMASMEGKSVSMKVYVGTIVGVVVLMLLARCGG